jgi:hypothetical protein
MCFLDFATFKKLREGIRARKPKSGFKVNEYLFIFEESRRIDESRKRED